MDASTTGNEQERDDPLFQVTVVWESLSDAAAQAGLTVAVEPAREAAEETRAA